jgi:hypothetical protein
MTLNPSSAFLLLPAMIVLLEVGRRLRRQHADAVVSSAIEGAIFGLFGCCWHSRSRERSRASTRIANC